MRTEVNSGLMILYPDEGKRLATADRTAAYEGSIYLGKNDFPGNYIEVTPEEADIINGLYPEEEKVPTDKATEMKILPG